MDPINLAIAAAVSAKGAEMAVTRAPVAWRGFLRVLRDRLAREKQAAELLEQAQTSRKPATVQSLAEEISRIRQADTNFDQELRRAWSLVVATSPQLSNTTNIMTGSVGGHLIQANEVSGIMSFGDVEAAPTPPPDGQTR